MSKICPECQEVFDDSNAFCSNCGSRLVEMTGSPTSTLNLGDANAISGGVSINQSKNITSHEVHYHTTQERKSDKELELEKRNQYQAEVAKCMKNGVITTEARLQLDNMRLSLGIDTETSTQIEFAVKNEQKIKASNESLPIIGKMALKGAIAAVEENNHQAQGCIAKLAPVCKTVLNEQVHFYYNMLLAAYEPRQCVDAYKHRTVDSYWQAFWTSLACRKLGDELAADDILNEVSVLWRQYPEINVIVNVCAGLLLSNQGRLSACFASIMEYLTQSDEKPSALLDDLYHTLLFQVGVEETDDRRYAFYKENFLPIVEEANSKTDFGNRDDEMKVVEEQLDREGLENIEHLLPICRKWVLRDDAEAQLILGIYYSEIKKDAIEAARWIHKVAELDESTLAHTDYFELSEVGEELGNRYKTGRGVPQDNTEAIRWFLKAGESYYTKEYYHNAADCFREAAELGDAQAQKRLGDIYADGVLSHQKYPNWSEAWDWYLKAAEQGHFEAICALVHYYDNFDFSYFSEEEKADAIKWCLKAAELGDAEAQCGMGYLYENGLGVSQNHKEARKWYQKAADQGFEEAKEALENLQGQI